MKGNTPAARLDSDPAARPILSLRHRAAPTLFVGPRPSAAISVKRGSNGHAERKSQQWHYLPEITKIHRETRDNQTNDDEAAQ